MADALGCGMHNLVGYSCDYCGKDCDPEAHELNALDCTFAQCPSKASVYHQDCLERYLKSIRLEKSRKTGFKCPRGAGKGTAFSTPCPGKINKSHPIYSRSEDTKKRRKAPPPPMPERVKPNKDKTKAKEDSKAKEGKADKAAKKTGVAVAKAAGAVLATPRDKAAARVPTQKQQLAAAAAAMKHELGLKNGPQTTAVKAAPSKGVHTLEEYESSRAPIQAPMAWANGRPQVAAKTLQKTRDAVSQPGSPPIAVPRTPVRNSPEEGTTPQGSWSAVLAGGSQASGSNTTPTQPSHKKGSHGLRLSSKLPAASAVASQSQPPAPATPPQPPSDPTALKAGDLDAGNPSGPAWAGVVTAALAGKDLATPSKAQRKNQRRAEKKTLARDAAEVQVSNEMDCNTSTMPLLPDRPTALPVTSAAASVSQAQDTAVGSQPSNLCNGGTVAGEAVSEPVPLQSSADTGVCNGGGDGRQQRGSPVYLRGSCLQAMQNHRLRQAAASLAVFGFADWQCLAACSHADGDVQGALEVLLQGMLSTPAQAQALLEKGARDWEPCQWDVEYLHAAQESSGMEAGQLQQLILDAGGDLDAAAVSNGSLREPAAGPIGRSRLVDYTNTSTEPSSAGWHNVGALSEGDSVLGAKHPQGRPAEPQAQSNGLHWLTESPGSQDHTTSSFSSHNSGAGTSALFGQHSGWNSLHDASSGLSRGSSHVVGSPDAALLAAAAIADGSPPPGHPSSRLLTRPGEQSELESLLATLLCSY
ncbi:hypothetical protein WJX73_006553 [Symbiochloris irregularis]|uniref:UBA domain-containing protein n=1 Tax=Symbiochloris irregularis TaxID=706552 RepID=A0AAW1PE34_9CHLO